MRTKAVWLILVLLISTVTLSGCGGGAAANPSTDGAAAGTGKQKEAPRPSKEQIIQEHLVGRELDPIEGIWLWDSGEYEAAIFQGTDKRHPGYEYVAVLTGTKRYGWLIGDVKVALKKTASDRLYAVDYYMGDRTLTGTIATLTNDTVLEMNLPNVGRTALVKIYPIKGKSEAKPARTGAGFFVAKDVVATNYHLVVDAKQVAVALGEARFGAKLLVGDRVNDLALLKVEFSGNEAEKNLIQTQIVPLALGEVRSVKQGEKVFAGGFPADGDVKKGNGVFDCVVSSTAALDGDPRLFQVSLPVLPLNIGGPLFNTRGEVIGVSTSTADNPYLGVKKEALPNGVNLVVKANYLANLLATLPPEVTLGSKPSGGELTSAQLAELTNKALVLIETKD